jgi:SPOR domain
MHKSLIILSLFLSAQAIAQTDSNTVVVNKDSRIEILVRKQVEINEETTRETRRNIPGYRIQLVNSADRNAVYAAKTKVYQQFPELKLYLMYQSPNYKLKAGNFKTQEEAEEYSRQLSKLFPSGVYVIRDTIEVKVDTP